MSIKIVTICLYIVFVYWLSLSSPTLKSLFYPTLGAFSFLFISRTFEIRSLGKIVLAAGLASMLGVVCYMIHGGIASLFVDALITAWLIHKYHWNAPPILAVSFIPFFTHSEEPWIVPLSVLATLAGLLIALQTAEWLEKLLKATAGARAEKRDADVA